jgi:hypothetical protein
MSADVQVAGGCEKVKGTRNRKQMNRSKFRLIGKIYSANIAAISQVDKAAGIKLAHV